MESIQPYHHFELTWPHLQSLETAMEIMTLDPQDSNEQRAHLESQDRARLEKIHNQYDNWYVEDPEINAFNCTDIKFDLGIVEN